MTIYVVTSGSYSDYGIDGLYSTRELAQEYMDKKIQAEYYEEPRIEEWVLDQDKDCQVLTHYGTEINIETGEIEERSSIKILEHPDKKFEVIKWAVGSKSESLYTQSLKSQEHANKLAVEARQKHLAGCLYKPVQ